MARDTATTLIRGVDLVATPWKNGGGVTREIAAYPHDAGLETFVWRVSVAEVAQAGPFSRFAGIDRTLVLLSGAGMRLDDAQGTTHALTEPLDSACFAGEAAIDAQLVDGPTRDFNLMVRRGVATGAVELWRDGGQHTVSADVALLFCAAGTLDVSLDDATPVSLATQDTLRVERPQALRCAVSGTGALLAVTVRYTGSSQA